MGAGADAGCTHMLYFLRYCSGVSSTAVLLCVSLLLLLLLSWHSSPEEADSSASAAMACVGSERVMMDGGVGVVCVWWRGWWCVLGASGMRASKIRKAAEGLVSKEQAQHAVMESKLLQVNSCPGHPPAKRSNDLLLQLAADAVINCCLSFSRSSSC